MRDAVDTEAMGIASAVVIADALFGPADAMRRLSGLPDYPLLDTPFPVGACTPDELATRADDLVDRVVAALCGPTRTSSASAAPDAAGPARRDTGAALAFADEATALSTFFARGWTDGLPVVVPTVERVEQMLAAGGRPGDDVAISVPARAALSATVRDVAVHAVMAGCPAELFGHVLAAVDALADPQCNVHAHTGTMSGAQQLVVVNGPRRHDLGFVTTDGGLGPGWRANETLGRAVRLLVRNRLRSVHGEFDRAGFSHPGRVGWCLAEDEERSPWPPLATQASGATAGRDAVSVYASVWQASVINHDQRAGALLDEIGLAARTGCHVNWLHHDVASDSSFAARRPFLFVTGHEHARVLAREGFGDLGRLRDALFERLTAPHPTLRPVAIAAPDNLHVAYLHATGMQQTWFFAPFQSHHLVTRYVDDPPPYR